MKIVPVFESKELVKNILDKAKKELKKKEIKIEFIQLDLDETNFERCNCAYLQNTDKKSAILYEALTNRFFAIKEELGKPVLYSLHGNISKEVPKNVLEKMFWVCGNKADTILIIDDFSPNFKLTKPNL